MRDKWSRRLALATWVLTGLFAVSLAITRDPVPWWVAAALGLVVALDAFDDWYKARRPRPWERKR